MEVVAAKRVTMRSTSLGCATYLLQFAALIYVVVDLIGSHRFVSWAEPTSSVTAWASPAEGSVFNDRCQGVKGRCEDDPICTCAPSEVLHANTSTPKCYKGVSDYPGGLGQCSPGTMGDVLVGMGYGSSAGDGKRGCFTGSRNEIFAGGSSIAVWTYFARNSFNRTCTAYRPDGTAVDAATSSDGEPYITQCGATQQTSLGDHTFIARPEWQEFNVEHALSSPAFRRLNPYTRISVVEAAAARVENVSALGKRPLVCDERDPNTKGGADGPRMLCRFKNCTKVSRTSMCVCGPACAAHWVGGWGGGCGGGGSAACVDEVRGRHANTADVCVKIQVTYLTQARPLSPMPTPRSRVPGKCDVRRAKCRDEDG
jgi:hypothetical protein